MPQNSTYNNVAQVNPRIIVWMGGHTSSFLAIGFYQTVFSWSIANQENSPSSVGWIWAASGVPAILLFFFAGSLADSRQQLRALVIGNLVRSLPFFILAAVTYLQQFPVLSYAFAVGIVGIGSTFTYPAMNASFRQLLPAQQVTRYVFLRSILQRGGIVIASLIAGRFLIQMGQQIVFGLVATCFMLAAIATSFLPNRENVNQLPTMEAEKSNWIWAFLRSKIIIYSLLTLFVDGLFVTIFNANLPFLETSLINDPEAYALLFSTMMIGLWIGSSIGLLFKRIQSTQAIKIHAFTCLSQIILILTLVLLSNFTLLLVVLTALGVLMALETGLRMGIILQAIPLTRQGRVHSIFWLVNAGLAPLLSMLVLYSLNSFPQGTHFFIEILFLLSMPILVKRLVIASG